MTNKINIVSFLALFFFLIEAYHCFRLPTSQDTNHAGMMEKRQDDSSTTTESTPTDEPTFDWPEFDGPIDETVLALVNVTPPVLEWGYWYANQTFLTEYSSLMESNFTASQYYLFDSLVQFATEWTDDCCQLTNTSAATAQRTNTLGRVIVFPWDQPDSPVVIQNISQPFELGCWERDATGDPNVPLFSYTDDLIKQLGWDEDTAVQVATSFNSVDQPTK